MIRRYRLLILLAMFALMSVWAIAEPSAEEDALQRRTLEALRKHPDHLVRLRENLQAFNAMSESRKNAVIKLDQELEKTTGKTKERLWNALSRYADWLEELRKSDLLAYEKIKYAPDAEARLALIKDQREREWMETQPKKHLDEWDKLKGEARVEYLRKRREAERVKQNQWVIAKRFWVELERKDPKDPMPCRLSDFKEKGKKKDEEINRVKDYFNDYIFPYITDAQKKQLDDAEGRWPDFPQTLAKIARQRPAALPPKGEKLPTKLSELPKPIQTRVQQKAGKKKLLDELKAFEGRPEEFVFASKVVEVGTKKGSVPFEYEFWACNFSSLQKPMQGFMTELTRKLNEDEKTRLRKSENDWPEYPKTIQKLAEKYNLQPPWHYLPDPDNRWKWDLYRAPRATSWETEAVKE